MAIPISEFFEYRDDAEVSVNPAGLTRTFGESARQLTVALLEYRENLGAAPASVQSELEVQWAVFQTTLPAIQMILSETGDSFAGEGWSDSMRTVTERLHLVIGMFGLWLEEEPAQLLQLLDSAEALRPDVDMSSVRDMLEEM